MKDLIEFIAKSLVEHPDEVQVTETINGNHVRLELKVNADDMANSIRTLLHVAAERDGRQVTLDVLEP
jgi:predicted RNA-binding protein YlqC (UPF0109 family)